MLAQDARTVATASKRMVGTDRASGIHIEMTTTSIAITEKVTVLPSVLDAIGAEASRTAEKPVAIVSAAHRTETVEQHAQLVVTIAGGVPVGPSALFRLKGLDVDDPSVGHALRQALDALDEAVLGQEDRRRAS